MITLKSEREIKLLREANRVVALVHQTMASAIKPGVSLITLDRIAEKVIRDNGCTPSCKGYGGFPNSICASVNDALVHGIPNHYKLKNGDIVTIDVCACYRGYHGDGAYTYKVGDVSAEAEQLLKVTEEALYIGLSQVKPGNRVGDISNAIQTYVESFGYSLPEEYTGHGVGTSIHEDPNIPNVGIAHTGPLLKKGMVMAVEPMVFAGKKDCVTMSDGWTVKSRDHSLGAHFEHTIVITDDGYEILTKL
ncbi:MAG: type I methionyl aminopeptidase [Erysipelotrichaceae bacterium]|nr:type I methionyl aminopeptidase [Erysipelotrichaceae bacterium]